MKSAECTERKMGEGREGWLDVAKGIGMALVVFCHFKVSFLTTYIYWFHMPLFFILSGYLHKQPGSFSEILFVIVQKTYRFFVPYTAYYFLIWFGMRAYFQMPLAFTKNDLRMFLFGGEDLKGSHGVFWFITVLYVTEVTFLFVLTIKCAIMQCVVIMCFYVLSHAPFLKGPCFWAADVMFYAICFYVLGHLIRKKKTVMEHKFALIGAAAAAICAVLMQMAGRMNYVMAMKNKTYHHWLLDLIIPTSFCMIVFWISIYIEKSRVGKLLAEIGRNSLPIMYLHIPVVYVLSGWVDADAHFLLMEVLAVGIPYVLSHFILKKVQPFSFVFLGSPNHWLDWKLKKWMRLV